MTHFRPAERKLWAFHVALGAILVSGALVVLFRPLANEALRLIIDGVVFLSTAFFAGNAAQWWSQRGQQPKVEEKKGQP